MSILDLYHHGIINFLFKAGLLSGSALAYVEYFKRYQQERAVGAGYRESIRRTSREFGVSETTVKKAIRLFNEKSIAHHMDSNGSTMLNMI
jgi:hypothetical protein